MNVQTKNKQKGFTIIEVVLVLAIAALIFLMVFIALPALQRNQRDTQRKNDVGRAATALTNYSSNNRGAIPSNWGSFNDEYMKNGTAGGTDGTDEFADPTGGPYVFTPLVASSKPTAKDDTERANMYYTVGATCGTDGSVVTNQGSRKVAFRVKLEGAGYACSSN
jgi:prepilin-type N-terminal cleavage/methylation domain-containing protein